MTWLYWLLIIIAIAIVLTLVLSLPSLIRYRRIKKM